MTKTPYSDANGKATVQAECDKRNKHVLKTHSHRWIPLWCDSKGWHPAFRLNKPKVETKKCSSPQVAQSQ